MPADELDEIAPISRRFCDQARPFLQYLQTQHAGTELEREAARLEIELSVMREALCAKVPAAAADLLFEAELGEEPWQHPRQVLPASAPDLDSVLSACQRQLEAADDELRPVVERVIAKVENALRAAETARRQRRRFARTRA